MPSRAVLLFLWCIIFHIALGSLDKLVLVVISQSNSFHVTQTNTKLEKWKNELQSLTKEEPLVIVSHELELEGTAWTIVPLIRRLAKYTYADWFLFITEDTDIDFSLLESCLAPLDSTEELFLGHALSDKRHTIAHHYAAPNSISYPNFPSGFILSGPVLQRAAQNALQFGVSFNIDPQFELAVFLKYQYIPNMKDLAEGSPPPPPATTTPLTHLPCLCLPTHPALHHRPAADTTSAAAGHGCATVYRHDIPMCQDKPRVSVEEVHFAVKTYSKFHSLRLPVVKATWAADAGDSIAYYSDMEDKEYSTIDIGVANTERGHCAKSFAIVKKFYADLRYLERKWLVLADDDTLLSVSRLLRLLQCYDHTHPIVLGEGYGYEAAKPRGITFITGGGGIVLSQQAVKSLMKSEYKCPSDEFADDMFFGSMASLLKWDIVHSPLFHQSQPPSFPEEVLSLQTPISFHRHHPLDPLMVYNTYLQDHTPSLEQDHMRQLKTEL